MWRHIEADGPEVDLLVGVDAGHDEEEARALGAPRPQPPQPEDDGSLVLLHNLDTAGVGNIGVKREGRRP